MGIILESDRLVIRNLKSDDITSLYEYRNDYNCAKYQAWADTSKKYLKEFIENQKNKTIEDNRLQLAIAIKTTNELIGDIFVSIKDRTISLGYTIKPKFQRQGYAYETLKEFIKYLFNRFKGYEIVCMVHPENEASKNLLKKMNFINEGYFEKRNSIVYSLQSDL
jgi:[ribosomal protein S5]-alanine N-acetyltransferase